MCGICGIVDLDGPPERETVRRMAAAIAHRGPDGDGFFFDDGVALGHRRLAILDLSDAGLQPFASDDGRYQLLHNGEVYNYRELRAELEGKGHRFRTGTDTEVVLAAFREWGEACVRRFNGMWAIAVWDREERSLFCSRDRFGVKPFLYRLDGSRFAFASEIKAFRADRCRPLRANPRVVRDYLEQGYLDHTVETFVDGIVRLPPAHSLRFDRNGLRIERYWALEERDAPAGDPADAFRELFLDSVRLRLRSDVPVGTALSGGLDSSAIAVTVDHLLETEAENARPVGERQKTFTAYFEDKGFDERPYAEAVVDRTRTDAHWISYTDTDLVDSLPAVIDAQEEPFGSASIVSQWWVWRAAGREGLKVMLNGQGADEILAGYPVYYGSRYADLLTQARLRELGGELSAFRRLHGASAARAAAVVARPLLPDALKWRLRARVTGGGALTTDALKRLPTAISPEPNTFHDHLRRQLHVILAARGLPELLHYEDRNSMSHSMEARLPFLDYRLVELMFSLDGAHLISGGKTKVVMRRALSDLFPPVVRDRVDKLGFVTPGGRFFRGALGDLALDLFRSKELRERGFVDGEAAAKRLLRHRAGELEAGFELWRAMNLELWARAFVDAP
jgi:asparagine synthase (glutamine-hydrolysing)